MSDPDSGRFGKQQHVELWIARGLTLGFVALALPVAALAVFSFGADRNGTADLLAVIQSVGLFAGFTTSFWPLPSLRSWPNFRRIESLCFVFMVVSYATHLCWELCWLVLHYAILSSPDAAWAYPWWAYIGGMLSSAKRGSRFERLLTQAKCDSAKGLPA